MYLVLSHATAFRFWRTFTGNIRLLARPPQPKAMVEAFRPTPDIIAELLALGVDPAGDDRIHLLFSEARLRSRTRNIASHVYSEALPEGALVQLSEHVLAASPELTYVQMSEVFTFERQAIAGMELCGSYAILPDGSLKARTALAHAEDLHTWASALAGPRSRGTLAAPFVLDGAASPMEAKLALLLTLPTARGGYHLPAPVLNHRIDLGAEARRLYDAAFCRADLYWPEARVDVEYDGLAYHEGEAHAVDVAREQALAAQGISVMRLTYAQVEDPDAFAVVAKTLGKRLGRQVRVRHRDFVSNQLFLRAELGL